jgi:hypothetical protein
MDSISAPESPAPTQAAPAEAAPQAASPFQRLLARVFTRHVMNIAILMALPVIFSVSLNPLYRSLEDPDIWWHLADARQLVTTHHFMHAEPNSFTVGGKPWVNPEWLAELPYWFSYKVLHYRGIYLLEWVVLCANLVFIYWRGYRRSGHAGAAWWAAALGFTLVSVNAGPRTIALAYLAMGVELAILEAYERGNSRALWLLPPLFCVWVNLHGSWLIGLALFVLYILCGAFEFKRGVIEQEAMRSSDRNRLLIILGLCLVALLINPYGWRLAWNPIDMMTNQKLNIANVAEWKPLDLSSAAGMFAFAAMGLMVVANALKGRKWRIYELAIVFFAWYAALDHMRFLFMAAVLTTPILAVDIRHGFDLESDKKTIPAANAFMVVAALVVIASIFPSEAKLTRKLGTFFPMKTIASIQPTWRTFNSDYVGGMMTFQSKPEFIDSRFDIFEHEGVLADYLKAMYLVSPLEILDKHRIDHLVLVDTMPLSYLLKHSPGWTIIKRERTRDDLYVLFARTPGAPAGAVAADAGDGGPIIKDGDSK